MFRIRKIMSNFFRWSSNHSEKVMDKLRKENVYLRKTLDEVSRQKGAPSDSQNKHFLLERILSLETLKEKNTQQILARDQEITSLRSDSAEVVSSLHAQLNQLRADAEMRDRLFQSLKLETEELKNNLTAVSTKCQDLQNSCNSGTADGRVATESSLLIEDELKDALEKNHQWLVHDQQREAYVKVVLEGKYQLEQELHQAKKALLQNEVDLEEQLQVEKQQFAGELEREQQNGQRLLIKYQQVRKELEKERLKSAELQQQIQLSARNLEKEKCDNQHLQWQLHKGLKELQKVTDKVAILESEKLFSRAVHCELQKERHTSSSVSNAFTALERVPKGSPQRLSSPTRAHSLLDDSFLECPNCRVQYPTSRHRELLVHIDQCCDENVC